MFLKPDYNLKNIYHIPADELKSQGIKAILLDLDSTVMVSKTGKYLPETIDWFNKMQQDFKLAIVSNNNKEDYLKKVSECTPFLVIGKAGKPGIKGIKQALSNLNVKPEEAVMVGDRPLTDILAGKRANMKTILVQSISYDKENWLVHFVRWLERLSIR